MMAKPLLPLLTVAILFAGSGASCHRANLLSPFAAVGPVAPHLLLEGASREEIVAAVNQNSSKIQSLSVTGATITIPDRMAVPTLRGNIGAQRPGRFRLTASTALTGQEVDLGSNDELFWVWVRRNQPPAVYICRHDQFAGSAAQQVMPIEPAWFLSAIGMVELDPATIYEGPLPHGEGTVEIHAWLPSSIGTLRRILVIDARRGWVIEQHVYDPTGTTLLASAVAESHRYYPMEQVSLPDRVAIRLPTAGLALTIQLGEMQINQLTGDSQPMWTLPPFEGYPQHDLGGAPSNRPLRDILLPGRAAAQITPPANITQTAHRSQASNMPEALPQYQGLPAGGVPILGPTHEASLRFR